MLTNNQIIHRQYLKSAGWALKRTEALAHYGAICNRCGKHGTDVHHRTYERVGGGELMEDLEILCRSCHEAHHQAERCAKQKAGVRGRKGINHLAVFKCLTVAQKRSICKKLGITQGDLYVRLHSANEGPEMREALRMLGMDYAYGFRKDPKHKAKDMISARSCLVRAGSVGKGRRQNRSTKKKLKVSAKFVEWHKQRMAAFDALLPKT